VHASLTIEEFHALLACEDMKSPLLVALRKLMRIRTPEEIARLSAEPRMVWSGWN
jgi:hypothetical protein